MTQDQYEKICSILRVSLETNIGNKLTQELAVGIYQMFTSGASKEITQDAVDNRTT
jgi:hypothetical protein